MRLGSEAKMPDLVALDVAWPGTVSLEIDDDPPKRSNGMSFAIAGNRYAVTSCLCMDRTDRWSTLW